MLFEVKPGPYRPNEFADWAPPEGDAAVAHYLESLALIGGNLVVKWR